MVFLSLLVFCSGIYVLYNNTFRIQGYGHGTGTGIETMDTQGITTNTGSSLFSICPDTLMYRNKTVVLYNSANPDEYITFVDMNDYTHYMYIQKKLGNKCPVLNPLPDTTCDCTNCSMGSTGSCRCSEKCLPEPIIDATHEGDFHNDNSYASFDPYGLQNGKYTVLDKIHGSVPVRPVVST
jgi:hypothetical protein